MEFNSVKFTRNGWLQSEVTLDAQNPEGWIGSIWYSPVCWWRPYPCSYWKTSLVVQHSKMAKGLDFLGFQDAAWKRRMLSQTLGAWAGVMVSSDGSVVRKGVMKEHWEKVKSKIWWIANETGLTDEFTPDTFGELSKASEEDGGSPKGKLQFKTTESCLGFLIYVTMTYPWYLISKGSTSA